MRESTGRKPPATHQLTKAEMEEVIVIDGRSDAFAATVLRGRAHRREPEKQDG